MNSISDYLTVTTPLPRYLPYARFLLDTDLSHTAKLLYTLLLDRATLSQKNNWIDAQGRIYVLYPLSSRAEMSNMIAQKRTPNQRNKNDLKDNHLIKTTDAHLTFGEYRNVFLTEKEYKQLKADFFGLDSLIEQLSAYIQSTGKRYADHAATLRIWAKRQKTERKSTPGIPDYTFTEGESL